MKSLLLATTLMGIVIAANNTTSSTAHNITVYGGVTVANYPASVIEADACGGTTLTWSDQSVIAATSSNVTLLNVIGHLQALAIMLTLVPGRSNIQIQSLRGHIQNGR